MKSRFKYRHQYDLESEEEMGELAATDFPDPSLTQQQYTDEVNLNVMVKRFGITDGALPPAAMDPRFFGDFSEAVDLRDIFDRVREATNRFNELPADLRKRFNHDPAQLLAFVEDPANHKQAVELGLLHYDTSTAPEAPVVKETP